MFQEKKSQVSVLANLINVEAKKLEYGEKVKYLKDKETQDGMAM
jgi:hypothetical protein